MGGVSQSQLATTTSTTTLPPPPVPEKRYNPLNPTNVLYFGLGVIGLVVWCWAGYRVTQRQELERGGDSVRDVDEKNVSRVELLTLAPGEDLSHLTRGRDPDAFVRPIIRDRNSARKISPRDWQDVSPGVSREALDDIIVC